MLSLKDLRKSIAWESFNWGRAIKYWFENINLEDLNSKEIKILELGGGKNCEISMIFSYLDSKNIVCSDIDEKALKIAKERHKALGFHNINYEVIDILNIPYSKFFDIIAFKSVLGGVARGDNNKKRLAIKEIYKTLRSNGYLMFVENLEATKFHKILRQRFTKWGKSWNYLKYTETKYLLKNFSKVSFKTYSFYGFLAPYKFRDILGYTDFLFGKVRSRTLEIHNFRCSSKVKTKGGY